MNLCTKVAFWLKSIYIYVSWWFGFLHFTHFGMSFSPSLFLFRFSLLHLPSWQDFCFSSAFTVRCKDYLSILIYLPRLKIQPPLYSLLVKVIMQIEENNWAKNRLGTAYTVNSQLFISVKIGIYFASTDIGRLFFLFILVYVYVVLVVMGALVGKGKGKDKGKSHKNLLPLGNHPKLIVLSP